MVARVRQVERTRARRDRADKALAKAQLRQMHRAGIEAFRGVEFQHRVGAQHIKRAHFGDHVGGDFAHDPVEPLLRLQGFGHDLAQPLQQYARAAGDFAHRRFSNDHVPPGGHRHGGRVALKSLAYCLSSP
jgi:hypothetical protein